MTEAASVGVGSLVGTGALETDGERRNRLAPVAAAEAEDDRGVEPAADVGDDRYITAQTDARRPAA